MANRALYRAADISTLSSLYFFLWWMLGNYGTSELPGPDSFGGWISLIATLSFPLLMYLELTSKKWKVARWCKSSHGVPVLILYLLVFLDFEIGVLLCLIALSAVYWILTYFAFKETNIFDEFKQRPSHILYHTAIVIPALLVALWIFGTTIYGYITPQFGGGYPSRVRISVPEEKMVRLLQETGLKNLNSMLLDTQLLESTDNRLLVLLKSSHGDKGLLMQIEQSLVDSILYLPQAPIFPYIR